MTRHFMTGCAFLEAWFLLMAYLLSHPAAVCKSASGFGINRAWDVTIKQYTLFTFILILCNGYC